MPPNLLLIWNRPAPCAVERAGLATVLEVLLSTTKGGRTRPESAGAAHTQACDPQGPREGRRHAVRIVANEGSREAWLDAAGCFAPSPGVVEGVDVAQAVVELQGEHGSAGVRRHCMHRDCSTILDTVDAATLAAEATREELTRPGGPELVVLCFGRLDRCPFHGTTQTEQDAAAAEQGAAADEPGAWCSVA